MENGKTGNGTLEGSLTYGTADSDDGMLLISQIIDFIFSSSCKKASLRALSLIYGMRSRVGPDDEPRLTGDLSHAP